MTGVAQTNRSLSVQVVLGARLDLSHAACARLAAAGISEAAATPIQS